MRGLLNNKDNLVELIDSFEKVQVFTITHVNKDLDYGTLFGILGFGFVSKPRQNGSSGGICVGYKYKFN